MSEIPELVRELVRQRTTSMDHIEVLMRLHGAAGNAVTAADVERSSRLDPNIVSRCLSDLVAARLAMYDPAARTYAYAPQSPEDVAAVEALSTMYHQRPVTLVRLVYEQPPAPVKSFADAFRLRNDSNDSKER